MTNKIKSIIYNGIKYKVGDNILVGGSDVDLTDYATNAYVDEQIANLTFDCDWDESRIAALEALVNQLNERIDNLSSGGSGETTEEPSEEPTETPSEEPTETPSEEPTNGSRFIGMADGESYTVKINNENISIANYDTYYIPDDVTDMSGMFYECFNLQYLIFILNKSTVTNMSNMFAWCVSLTGLDVSNFDTSNVTNMSSMFAVCGKLTSLDLSNFDTSNVTSMNNMFEGCSALTKIYCKQAFYDWCIANASTIDLNDTMINGTVGNGNKLVNQYNWVIVDYVDSDESTNASKFSGITNDGNKYVVNINSENFQLLSGKTYYMPDDVTDMQYMFNGCSNLTSLDLSNFDTSNVTDMQYMFYDCSALTSLNVSNFDTSNVTDMSGMFSSCFALTKIYCKQAFYDWCITNASNISLPTTMQNGTVGDANEEGADYNWMIVDYVASE